MEKVAIFIDAANLSWIAKTHRFDVDFTKLKQYFSRIHNWNIVNALYYTALVEDQQGFNELQSKLDWLKHNGYNIKSKRAKQFRRPDGSMRVKGNMDIEMTIDMVKMSDSPHINRFVLFSGDGDFKCVVEYLQDVKGIPVTVVSAEPMISRDLRAQCNQYIDLAEVKEELRIRPLPTVEVVEKRSIVRMINSRGVK